MLTVGEPVLTPTDDLRSWMLPAFTRCPATTPSQPSTVSLAATAALYRRHYRAGPDPTAASHPDSRLITDRADRVRTQSTSSADRAVRSPASRTRVGPALPPPLPTDPPASANSARSASRRSSCEPHDASTKSGTRELVSSQVAAAHAQLLASAITSAGCVEHRDLFVAAEQSRPGRHRPGPAQAPAVAAALALCRSCPEQRPCADLAKEGHYSGVAGARIYRDGHPIETPGSRQTS